LRGRGFFNCDGNCTEQLPAIRGVGKRGHSAGDCRMVKRENGFSRKTNDWEFIVLGGADLKMQKRETKGDCAACHSRAEKTDWVFRDYLK